MALKILLAVLIFAVLLALFIFLFLLNKKTKAPENCAKDDLPAGCASCMMACNRREEDFTPATLFTKKEAEEDKNIDQDELPGQEEKK